MNTFTSSVPYPPATSPILEWSSVTTNGTITGVSCGGAMDCTITDAAGNFLASFKTSTPGTFPVSLPFSHGAPRVVQRTPYDIAVTFSVN